MPCDNDNNNMPVLFKSKSEILRQAYAFAQSPKTLYSHHAVLLLSWLVRVVNQVSQSVWLAWFVVVSVRKMYFAHRILFTFTIAMEFVQTQANFFFLSCLLWIISQVI